MDWVTFLFSLVVRYKTYRESVPSSGGGAKRYTGSWCQTVNVMSILSTHLDNKFFESVNFCFETRSYFFIFVVIIVILLLLLLHNTNKNPQLRAALKTEINGFEKFII